MNNHLIQAPAGHYPSTAGFGLADVHWNSGLDSLLHLYWRPVMWKGQQSSTENRSLSHGKLLKGLITGLIWKVAPAVASQAVCFRLHWLCCALIYINLHCATIHADLFFQENDSHTLTMGVLLKISHLKIKCEFRELKIWYSNITKLLSRLINVLLYIIIKIVTTLKYFSSQPSLLVWTCPGMFFFSLFYPLESACSSEVSTKNLTSFNDIFPSPPIKDEDVITEQLKTTSASLVTLEFM